MKPIVRRMGHVGRAERVRNGSIVQNGSRVDGHLLTNDLNIQKNSTLRSQCENLFFFDSIITMYTKALKLGSVCN